MNKIVSYLCIIMFTSCSVKVIKNNSIADFEEKSYNFCVVAYKREAEYSFQFTNSGKAPLIIQDVKTSCGCTVPEWTKKPVKPGANGEIKIKYDAAFPGAFHKTITVFFFTTLKNIQILK